MFCAGSSGKAFTTKGRVSAARRPYWWETRTWVLPPCRTVPVPVPCSWRWAVGNWTGPLCSVTNTCPDSWSLQRQQLDGPRLPDDDVDRPAFCGGPGTPVRSGVDRTGPVPTSLSCRILPSGPAIIIGSVTSAYAVPIHCSGWLRDLHYLDADRGVRKDAKFRPGLRPEGMAPAGQSG